MMHGFRRPERDAQSNVQHTCGVVPGPGRRPPVVRAFLELDEMGTGGAERAVVVEQGEEQRNGELGGSPERSAAAESVERELMLLLRRDRKSVVEGERVAVAEDRDGDERTRPRAAHR